MMTDEVTSLQIKSKYLKGGARPAVVTRKREAQHTFTIVSSEHMYASA